MQPQGHVQVVVRIVDHDQNPQAACDGPRFRWVQGMQVCCERGFPPATLDELQRRGHELVIADDYDQFGSCQAIWRLDDGYLAVSDPRRDGQAVGTDATSGRRHIGLVSLRAPAARVVWTRRGSCPPQRAIRCRCESARRAT
ncbi:gamma-glutamyltranspeptidase family protein [Mycobacterium xenopi 4042]|uniref:Gamma-glutamyltranspeptidase family protein n=1 Tax=Mycobacterium xenopi 4042 TaxID=1299334 RepID=X7ZVA3_MYCXE|nr:gamma-glutamyltranspeptidase family protein [Mycobacterium xenopi 4042]